MEVLKKSLLDQPFATMNEVKTSIQSEVRYKLIIDPSEDDSLVRLLFTFNVLKREQTKIYVCSDLQGDKSVEVSSTNEQNSTANK